MDVEMTLNMQAGDEPWLSREESVRLLGREVGAREKRGCSPTAQDHGSCGSAGCTPPVTGGNRRAGQRGQNRFQGRTFSKAEHRPVPSWR